MSDTLIYHNPKCGTSRNTLALIRHAGIEPQVIHYLDTPPTRDELVALVQACGLSVREVRRSKGDANYTLVQVSVNDLIMVVAFAPIAAFLLGVTNVTVPWETLVLSTVLYVVLPLIAGMATRHVLARRSSHAVADFTAQLKPWSIVGLIATVVLLFGFQAGTIVAKPGVILLIAIPLTLQTYGIFAIAYLAARRMKLPHNVGGPACLIGTSNFFELAVAVAISLFGLNSGAALATVVGVLVEVPVMLTLVAMVNRSKGWYEQGQCAA